MLLIIEASRNNGEGYMLKIIDLLYMYMLRILLSIKLCNITSKTMVEFITLIYYHIVKNSCNFPNTFKNDPNKTKT